MYFQYGNTQFADNEFQLVSYDRQLIHNDRGYHQITRETMKLEATLFPAAATQAGIKTKVASVESAFGQDGQDAALYHDDGTISAHSMDSSLAIGGVKVLDLSYQKADRGEYITQRTVSVTLQADFPVTAPGLVAFQETLRVTGTGGADHTFIEVLNGPPQGQTLIQRTKVTAVQTGSAIGFSTWPDVLQIAPPIYPQFEKQRFRDVAPGPPQRDRNTLLNFPTSWTYRFEMPQFFSGVPHTA